MSSFQKSPYTLTLTDQFKVRIYFLRGWGNEGKLPTLPIEIIETIFDFAEYWPSVTYYRDDYCAGGDLNMLYLTASLPAPPTPNKTNEENEAIMSKCKKVEITCESHDQGWSGYPRDRGTYRNSWTWGEVSVVIPKQDIDFQDPTIDIGDKVIEKEPKVRHRIYVNKHADYDWQEHKYVFPSDHSLVRNLQPGDMVGIWIRSCYPAWRNHIKRAELKLYYTV